ncbi:type III ribulose-bisphosphate carboxylase [Candidatus Woesearchaeota archaeon]|nr:type III ribulose-bisphosphate carboxylase [Candidatus Woesearchaeota archaeon]
MLLEYIDLRYRPGKDDVVTQYYAEPDGVSFEKACEQIAGESSIGTWTAISTMNEKIAKRLKPHVFYMDKKSGIIKIAYPSELFEFGNMPDILSSIAGNIFGMKILKNLRLEDISFPKAMIRSFKGPGFGVNGIRKLVKKRKSPLLGTIVKPKVGLDPEQHAQVAYEAWMGGLDIVKDDENLTSQRFNQFEKRVDKTLELRDKAEKWTGEKKIYMPNVTAETNEMIRRAEYVKSLGGEYMMIDILTVGWAALQTMREMDLGMVIHAHRAMHGAITKNPKHGISMLTIAKIARLIGVDQLHIGTAVGKMEGSPAEIEAIEDEIEDDLIHPNKSQHVLEQRWQGVKPVFAVASGGLHPGLVPELIDILGTNIIAQFGGGCHGHPDGTRKGAMAIRQAVDAELKGIPLPEYARTHLELLKALHKWG